MGIVWQPSAKERVSVVGNIGTGKSVWGKAYTRNIYRCVTFDPMRESPMGGGEMTVAEFIDKKDKYRDGPLRVSIMPDRWDTKGMAEDFNDLCGAVYDVGAMCFKIEELSFVCTPGNVPDNFGRLAAAGRHRYVSLCVIGQRFFQFPLLVRGNSSRIIAYRQQDPDDVKDLTKRIGPMGAMASQLKDAYYLDWTPRGGVRYYEPIKETTDVRGL